MKQFIVIFLFAPILLSSQASGKIIYLETQKVNFSPRPGMTKEMTDRIPKERKLTRELIFNGTKSIYKKGKVQFAENSRLANNERMARRANRMMRRGENGASYKNLTSGQMIDQRMIMDKEFLVTDQIVEYKWKITGNKKQILDYLVIEAQTTIEDSININAWFTPQIPIQNGPSRFGGLPGLILELTQKNGDNTIIATDIRLGELDKEDVISEPKKGKEVSRKEFNEIRKEKREEMKAQGGGRFNRAQFRPRGN